MKRLIPLLASLTIFTACKQRDFNGGSESEELFADATSETVLSCVGDEPFWDLEVNNKQFLLKGDSEITTNASKTDVKNSPNAAADFVRVYNTKSTKGDLTIIVTKENGKCPAASEKMHPYFGSIVLAGGSGDVHLSGCCRWAKKVGGKIK